MSAHFPLIDRVSAIFASLVGSEGSAEDMKASEEEDHSLSGDDPELGPNNFEVSSAK